MKEKSTENNFKVGALIHDGLHIEASALDSEYMENYVISLVQEEILKLTGYELRLKIKP